MSHQEKLNKCLNLAFDKGTPISEATNAFLFARKLILNGKGEYAGKCSNDNKSDRIWTITCGGIHMMHMIEQTTMYAYKHNIPIEVKLHGKLLNPTARIQCKGSVSDIGIMNDIINLVYNTEY